MAHDGSNLVQFRLLRGGDYATEIYVTDVKHGFVPS